MTGDAVGKIQELSEMAQAPVEVNGHFYWPRSQSPVRVPRLEHPDAMRFRTLDSLIEWISGDPESASGDGLAYRRIALIGHEMVELFQTAHGPRRERILEAVAAPYPDDMTRIGFGQYCDASEMIINLQTNFVETEDSARLLQIIGNLVHEEKITQEDDGVTQVVTGKSGITGVHDVVIKNPFVLAPYRTFPEVMQPLSPFILRFRGKMPIQVALFECDGGQWKLDAISHIHDYMVEHGVSSDNVTLMG